MIISVMSKLVTHWPWADCFDHLGSHVGNFIFVMEVIANSAGWFCNSFLVNILVYLFFIVCFSVFLKKTSVLCKCITRGIILHKLKIRRINYIYKAKPNSCKANQQIWSSSLFKIYNFLHVSVRWIIEL